MKEYIFLCLLFFFWGYGLGCSSRSIQTEIYSEYIKSPDASANFDMQATDLSRDTELYLEHIGINDLLYEKETCPTYLTLCDGQCVDLQTNILHCGACGEKCGTCGGAYCSKGQCMMHCGPEQCVCNNRCVDHSSDRFHCGGCNRPCVEGKICLDGTCQIVCSPDLVQCGERCIDLQKDLEHCGMCDYSCRLSQLCVSGSCIDTELQKNEPHTQESVTEPGPD